MQIPIRLKGTVDFQPPPHPIIFSSRAITYFTSPAQPPPTHTPTTRHPRNGSHPPLIPPSSHQPLPTLHLPQIPHLSPLLHPPTKPANAPRPTPQVVPANPAVLPAPPALQTRLARRARDAFIQERGVAEAVGAGGCGGGGGLDDEG